MPDQFHKHCLPRQAAAEQFQAHVSPLLGQLICLLGQNRTDKADDRSPVGEDPDARRYLQRRIFLPCRVVDQP